ncbi:MAG: tetratricopeptide repeat protein [Blastochloris sp.]|nr:tetratricopeptide repeat protein [Blastochloris sp.]
MDCPLPRFLLPGLLSLTLGAGSLAQSPPEPAAEVLDLSQFKPSESVLLEEAMGFVRAGNPGRAITLFLDLLRYHPEGVHAEEVLYRVARCYRDLGRFPEAREALSLWQKKYPQGLWSPAVQLLSGEMLAAEGKWKEALPLFQKSASSENKEIALRSDYLTVLAAENLRELGRAAPALTRLLAAGKDSPHYHYASLKQGTLLAEQGKGREALVFFKQVLGSGATEAAKAEAAVRAGQICHEAGEFRDAIAYYEVVRKTAAPDFWKKLAHFGLIQSHFSLPDYAATLKVFNEVRPEFPEQVRSQVFFLSAEAARLGGQRDEALSLYEFILKEFPKTSLAEPSLWGRILLLQSEAGKTRKGRESLLAETARYLGLFPKGAWVYQVQLIRADLTYEAQDYKAAAPMLAALIRNESGFADLAKPVQAALLFRSAHAALLLKDYAAAGRGFDRF